MNVHPHIPHTPQSRPPLPGLTPAVRGQWQSIGNAGMLSQAVAWVLCWYTGDEQGRSYALVLSILGVCAFLIELYGRLRYRKKQLPFPRGYSLCRYPGFLLAVAAVFMLWYTGEIFAGLSLLAVGAVLFWASLLMEKAQRRRLKAAREMEES